jgi:hypothetical protein
MVEARIRMVDSNMPFSAVRASRGKVVRADPGAAPYEQSRVHHVGSFAELEDQMCAFTTDFGTRATSPGWLGHRNARRRRGWQPGRCDRGKPFAMRTLGCSFSFCWCQHGSHNITAQVWLDAQKSGGTPLYVFVQLEVAVRYSSGALCLKR